MKLLESRHAARNVVLTGHREDRLTQPVVRQELDDALCSRYVELGEWVVEQEHRRSAAPLAERLGLQQPQRNRRRSLLTRRAEHAQLARRPVRAVEHDEQIITMWSAPRDAEADVERPLVA